MPEEPEPDYLEIALQQKLAELSDSEFDDLVSRTRPPRLTPQEAAARAEAAWRDQHVIRLLTDK